MKLIGLLTIIASLGIAGLARAHDAWLQSNTPRIAVGDMVYVDAMFGNHLNGHRSYQIVGKWLMDSSFFKLYSPNGEVKDIPITDFIDVGTDELKNFTPPYLDKNGHFVYSFAPSQRGLYILEGVLDTVVSHGGATRAVKCTKVMVGAVGSTMGKNDMPAFSGYQRQLNQDLEIIPLKDPTNLRVGDTLPVRVLFKGEPLVAGMGNPLEDVPRLSVVPRGRNIGPFPNEVYDPPIVDGLSQFTFTEANYHLLVVHHHTMEAGVHPTTGQLYEQSAYAAALTVIVKPANK